MKTIGQNDLDIKIARLEKQHVAEIESHQRELYALNFKDTSFVDDDYIEHMKYTFFENSSVHNYVMFEGEEMVGFYNYYPVRRMAHLSQIFIKAEYRQKGYGRKLFQHFEDTVMKNPYYEAIIFEASAMNDHAVKFYLKNKYEIIHRKIEMDEERYTMVKMLL